MSTNLYDRIELALNWLADIDESAVSEPVWLTVDATRIELREALASFPQILIEIEKLKNLIAVPADVDGGAP